MIVYNEWKEKVKTRHNKKNLSKQIQLIKILRDDCKSETKRKGKRQLAVQHGIMLRRNMSKTFKKAILTEIF